MNAAAAVVLGSWLAVLGACQAAAAPKAPDPAAKWTADEKKAVEVAQAFLAKRKVQWGMPTAVRPAPKGQAEAVGGDRGAFLVVYPTPARERQLLGERAVLVNITTGRAMGVPRE